MRNPNGYMTLSGPDEPGGMREMDTVQCGHCGGHQPVGPYVNPENIGGRCRACMRLVCARCASGGCHVWERKIEAIERAAEKAGRIDPMVATAVRHNVFGS